MICEMCKLKHRNLNNIK